MSTTSPAYAPPDPDHGATPAASTKPTTLLAAWPALLALCLTMLVEMLDNTLLTVALPTIGRDLASGTTGLQWMVAAYSLTFGGLLLVGGSLGDRFGRKRMLVAGLVGFGATSALVPLVESTGQFIALRAVCGVFAALVTPGTMSLLFRLFDDSKLRMRAIGIIMSVAMLGFALGPILGGLAVSQLPWEVLILVNVPATLIAVIGVSWGIPADDPKTLRRSGSDVLGAVLSMAALTLSLYSLTLGVSEGWTSPTTLGCALAAIGAVVGFVWRERTASDPMLDLSMLALPAVRGGMLLQTAVMTAMVGMGFASTQLLQYAWHWSPMQAGFGTLPIVAGMFLAAPLTDRLVSRAGHRMTCLIGVAFVLAGLGAVAFGVPHGYLGVGIGMFSLAVGVRFVMTTCAIALMEELPETHTSMGSALNDTAQEFGNSIGVAVVGTVMATVVGVLLPDGAWGQVLTQEFVHGLQIACGVLAGVVIAVAALGLGSLTNSRTLEEHPEPA